MAASVDQQARQGSRGARVCLVDSDPQLSMAGLANSLLRQGYRVTLLSIDSRTRSGGGEAVLRGVIREQLRAPGDLFVQLPYAARLSYLVYLFLNNRDFDCIHIPGLNGVAYYSMLARYQGLALQDSLLVVQCGCTRTQQVLCDNRAVDDVITLDELFMEQRCLGFADHVVCEDQVVLDCLRSETQLTPERTSMLASVQSQDTIDGETATAPQPETDWQTLYAQWLSRQPVFETVSRDTQDPLVSVCLVHFDRPQLLCHAIGSLYAQDYRNLEVILVDDGSTRQESIDYLASLEPEFTERGWRIVRQENAYLGAARNYAARVARGEYLLFMDDDNVATPGLVSTLVRVMQRIQVDILTCATNVFEGDGAAPQDVGSGTHWVPLGPAVASGMFRNVFGDATALIKKPVFDRLGGYTEDYGLGHEDWEFFARAVLEGCQLETVPVPLLFYRVRAGGMLLAGDKQASLARSLRPYLDKVPAEMRPILYMALGQEHSRQAGSATRPSPAVLLKLLRGFAGGSGKRDMVRRFIRVGRSQGWGVAIRAALRYSKQGS